MYNTYVYQMYKCVVQVHIYIYHTNRCEKHVNMCKDNVNSLFLKHDQKMAQL